ncbi:MAG: hypothetical protein QXG98_03875 [Candidatus Micrarchaeia archaeon]
MKPIQLLEQRARKNAAIEQANRLTVVRAIANKLHSGQFVKPGVTLSWKIEFIPKEGKKVFSPLVDDLARLRRDKGVVMYGVKDTSSIAEKKKRLVHGTYARKPAETVDENTLQNIKEAAEKFGLKEVIELFNELREKDNIANELFKSAANLRRAPEKEVEALLNNIRELVKEAAPEDRRIDHAWFASRVLEFTERKWPMTRDEAAAMVEGLDEAKLKRLDQFVGEYIKVEKKNLLRGSLEYSLYERFLELIHTLMLVRESSGEESVLDFHGELSALDGIIDSIEKKSRALKARFGENCLKEKFLLLCELARLRSDLLESVKNFADKCCKKKPQGYEHILYALSGLFFDFTATSPKEAELWEGFLKAFKNELSRKQRKNIGKYIKHLKNIQELPEAAAIESEQKRLLDAKKTERANKEWKLLESIKELALVAPVEGEILLRAYLEIKSHVRYKLGDWLYAPEAYFTPEKIAEVILRMIHEMKGGGTEYSVCGEPLTKYEKRVSEQYKKLLEKNEKIYALCEKIPASSGRTIADALDKAADSIGYVPENIFDAMYDAGSVDDLLKRGARDAKVVFEYSERVENGKRIISLCANGLREPIEVELTPVKFAHEFEKSAGIREAVIGKRLNVVLAALKAEEAAKRPEGEKKNTYALLAYYVYNHLEEIFNSEKEVRDPTTDLFLVACSAQRELNGITTRFGETPPKFMGENELEKNLRQKLGEDFEKMKNRVGFYLDAERIMAMLDEIHIRQKEIIVKELAWLKELAEVNE